MSDSYSEDDVVGADYQTDDAASHAGKCPDLRQYMLIEDAASQRLERHVQDVPADSKDQNHGQPCCQPWSAVRQVSRQIEIKQRKRHDGETRRGADGDPQSSRPQHQKHEHAEAQAYQRRQKTEPADRPVRDDRNRRDAKNHGEDEAAASCTRSRSSSSKALSFRGSEMV